jgi:hypothetical protein
MTANCSDIEPYCTSKVTVWLWDNPDKVEYEGVTNHQREAEMYKIVYGNGQNVALISFGSILRIEAETVSG